MGERRGDRQRIDGELHQTGTSLAVDALLGPRSGPLRVLAATRRSPLTG